MSTRGRLGCENGNLTSDRRQGKRDVKNGFRAQKPGEFQGSRRRHLRREHGGGRWGVGSSLSEERRGPRGPSPAHAAGGRPCLSLRTQQTCLGGLARRSWRRVKSPVSFGGLLPLPAGSGHTDARTTVPRERRPADRGAGLFAREEPCRLSGAEPVIVNCYEAK